ncbi:MAG: DUF4825 domain-containing protein [Clostridia bacterium]|nr:DUF4825 domain-containing protein [Clostridia bacterium]
MKNNLTCELVEDLMPSYIDGLTSEVTNKAIREHLATCDKCKAKLDNMKEPCSEEKIEEEKKEIDFLKKARKKNIRTVVSSIVAIILIVAVGFCTLPYLESERLFESDIIYDLEVKGDSFKLTMMPVSNEIVITDVIREEFGFGEVGLDIRGKKRSPFSNIETYTWEYTPDSAGYVKTLKIFDKILWEDGEHISDITWETFATKHLYMGDMPANSETAAALGIYKYLGSHTNKLQSSEEPYEWSIILSYELLPKQVKEKEELMKKYAYAILGVIDNLGAVTFEYEIFNSDGEDKKCELTTTREEASEYFGYDIGKCYDDINELQRLMEKTGLSDMPYPQQNDKDSFDVDINEVARVELFNASDAEIKKIELHCRETDTMAAQGFVDDWKFNIGKNPVVTHMDMNIWLESDLLSSNLYDDSRLGNLSVDVTVYDWDDNAYKVNDTIEVSAQFGAVYHFTLDGSFEEGFHIKTR